MNTGKFPLPLAANPETLPLLPAAVHAKVEAATPLVQVTAVVGAPEQIACANTTLVTLGNGLTVIVTCAVLTHPFALVPETVYVCVETGMNATAFVTPLFHTYEVAPLPFSVTAVPEQTDWLAPALTVGNWFTVMVACAVFTHPFALVPETVYV